MFFGRWGPLLPHPLHKGFEHLGRTLFGGVVQVHHPWSPTNSVVSNAGLFRELTDIHLNGEPLDPTSCKPVVNHAWIAEVGRRFVTLGVSYPIDPTDKKPTVVTGCHSLSRLSRLVTVCHACGRATRSTRSMRSPFHLVHLFHIVSENRHFNCKREIRALGQIAQRWANGPKRTFCFYNPFCFFSLRGAPLPPAFLPPWLQPHPPHVKRELGMGRDQVFGSRRLT